MCGQAYPYRGREGRLRDPERNSIINAIKNLTKELKNDTRPIAGRDEVAYLLAWRDGSAFELRTKRQDNYHWTQAQHEGLAVPISLPAGMSETELAGFLEERADTFFDDLNDDEGRGVWDIDADLQRVERRWSWVDPGDCLQGVSDDEVLARREDLEDFAVDISEGWEASANGLIDADEVIDQLRNRLEVIAEDEPAWKKFSRGEGPIAGHSGGFEFNDTAA